VQVFGIVSAAELFEKFEIIDDAGVILLKKFDEGRNTLSGNNQQLPSVSYANIFTHFFMTNASENQRQRVVQLLSELGRSNNIAALRCYA